MKTPRLRQNKRLLFSEGGLRSHGIDHAALSAFYFLRRLATNPTPTKPRINMAHVEGSGTPEIVVADSVNVPPRGFPAEHDTSTQSVGKILPASVPV